jgi:hypothetical protein
MHITIYLSIHPSIYPSIYIYSTHTNIIALHQAAGLGWAEILLTHLHQHITCLLIHTLGVGKFIIGKKGGSNERNSIARNVFLYFFPMNSPTSRPFWQNFEQQGSKLSG